MVRWSERMERSSGAAPSPQPGGSDATFAVRIVDSPVGAATVALSGELDVATVPKLEAALLEQLRQRPAVVIDLSELSFIDSSGIGALLQAKRTADGVLRGVVVLDGSQVDRIFGVAGIAEALPLFSSRQAALDAIRGARPG
jgi:anti-sigma B factor antagonist